MQAITTVSKISEQLKPLLKVVPNRPTHAILSYVKCEAVKDYKPCPDALFEQDGLILSAIDLSSFLSVFIPCQVLEVGSVCVPAFMFGKIIESLNGKEKGKKKNGGVKSLMLSTTVEDDQTSLILTSKGNVQTLACKTVEEFVSFPTVSDDVILTVNGLEFLTACKTLVKHVSKNDPANSHLSGIHFVDGRLIACDGYKIAYKNITVKSDSQLPTIIKPEFIEHLIRLGLLKAVQGAESDKLLDLKIEKDCWVQLQTENFCLTTRLEVYVSIPELQVGKTDYLTTEVNRTELTKKIELANLCNSEEYLDKDLSPIWLKRDNYGLHVVGAMSTDLVEPTSDIEWLSWIYEPATALIDAKKFIPMLKSVTTKTVVLNIPQQNPNLMGIESDGVSIGLFEMLRLAGKDNHVVADGLGWKRPNQLPYSWETDDQVGYYMVIHCNNFGFKTPEAMPYRFEVLAGLIDIPMLRVTRDAIAYGFAKAEMLPQVTGGKSKPHLTWR